MSGRILPYLFLSFLAVILAFTMGVRYGTRVEQSNKVITYFLTTTPPQPKPTEPDSPQEFAVRAFKDCGVSVLVPKEAAGVTPTAASEVRVACEKVTPVPTTAKAEATVTINGKKVPVVPDSAFGNHARMQITHPKTGRLIDISFPREYLPLFEQTLTFL
jgi:hypothetical protein